MTSESANLKLLIEKGSIAMYHSQLSGRAVTLPLLLAIVAGVLSGCWKYDDLFCERNSDCAGVADRSYCDTEARFEGADGVRKTCIEAPRPICDSAADCTDPSLPLCVKGLCSGCDEQGAGCSAKAPVCDVAVNSCGGCQADVDCAGFIGMPFCDAASHSCRGCKAHSECASGVCDIEANMCVDPSHVLYVDASVMTSGEKCTRDSPCKTIREGVNFISRDQKWILVRPGLYAEQVTIQQGDVAIVAPGVTWTRGPQGSCLIVKGGARVRLEGATLREALSSAIECSATTGADAPSVDLVGVSIEDNSEVGLRASFCRIKIDRSKIIGNQDGGVDLTACLYEIRNSFVIRNRGRRSPIFVLRAPDESFFGSQLPIIEFNTIAYNTVYSMPGSELRPGGIWCEQVTVPVQFSNNIIYNNIDNDYSSQEEVQISGGNCGHVYSVIGPKLVAGLGNVNTPPEFTLTSPKDVHLSPDSVGVNAADPNASLDIDIDGDVRPQDGRRDVGADEVVPVP